MNPAPKLDRLAWLQENFRSKSWIGSRLSVNSTQRWGGSFDGDLVKNRIEPTENGRKFRSTLLEARCGCVSQEHSWLEDRMEGKALRVQLERRVDSCWSWVVCFSSFIVQFLILGTHNSFGSFFVALLEEFQRSEAETGKENLYFLPQTKLARK